MPPPKNILIPTVGLLSCPMYTPSEHMLIRATISIIKSACSADTPRNTRLRFNPRILAGGLCIYGSGTGHTPPGVPHRRLYTLYIPRAYDTRATVR